MKFLSKLTLMMFPLFASGKTMKTDTNFELIQDFLPRLAAIESSGNPNAVGDKGKSLGMYQISKEAWRDGTDWIRLNCPEYLSGLLARTTRRSVWTQTRPSGLPHSISCILLTACRRTSIQ
jgi:hypothetical protein